MLQFQLVRLVGSSDTEEKQIGRSRWEKIEATGLLVLDLRKFGGNLERFHYLFFIQINTSSSMRQGSRPVCNFGAERVLQGSTAKNGTLGGKHEQR